MFVSAEEMPSHAVLITSHLALRRRKIQTLRVYNELEWIECSINGTETEDQVSDVKEKGEICQI